MSHIRKQLATCLCTLVVTACENGPTELDVLRDLDEVKTQLLQNVNADNLITSVDTTGTTLTVHLENGDSISADLG